MMTSVDPTVVLADPAWLAHRYEPGRDAVHFRAVSRAEHRAITFLTDEELPAGTPVVLGRAVAAAAVRAAPLRFIFHSAFCGSTLLARAFDLPGVASVLKEPVLLNDISGLRKVGTPPQRIAQALDSALTLLARPFEPGETMVVKPSNVINPMLPAMLAARPQATAVLLYAPLEVFLGSVARKGLWGRLWVRDLLAKLIAERFIALGFEGEDYLRLTDLQAAAVGWIAQFSQFRALCARHPARLRMHDSEALVARPAETMAATAALFGLRIDAEGIAAGPVFRRHSKSGDAFDGAARQAERAALEDAHADEIAKVATWARAVAANARVELSPSLPLLH